ncbi:MAG: hypothetical protein KatS3mg105_1358 [Gemmatales bacterium]|nr:MAG: hypothetical protein KatS3mg105_1358 [Gemmatales bacterium]
MSDKVDEAILEALTQASSTADEQPLYRAGKLAGLFPGRSRHNVEAATRAIDEGLLEVVRSETKGKNAIDWVRITPKGIEYVYSRQSPVRFLEELRDLLRVTQEGIPVWMAQLQHEWRETGKRLVESVQKLTQQINALQTRVEDALRRADLNRLESGNGTAPLVPWARSALAYLERRHESGAQGDCSFPELFAAVRQQHPNLVLPEFLEGLQRLQECRAVQLWPFTGPASELPAPEFALLDGATVLYYVTR